MFHSKKYFYTNKDKYTYSFSLKNKPSSYTYWRQSLSLKRKLCLISDYYLEFLVSIIIDHYQSKSQTKTTPKPKNNIYPKKI